MRPNSYTDEELLKAVKESTSVAETMRKLGLKPKGTYYTVFHNKIKEKKIDISHFISIVNKKAHNKLSKNDFIKKNCIKGKYYHSNRLKHKLIEFGILNNKCEICKNKGIWKGKHLILQIDHKNGNRKDNRIENLRLLCPNCHSQTETFGNKNHVRY